MEDPESELAAGMELFMVRRGSGEVSWESDPKGRIFHYYIETADINRTWSNLEALWPKLAANPRIRALTVRRKDSDFLVSLWEGSDEALHHYREMLGLTRQQVRRSTISGPNGQRTFDYYIKTADIDRTWSKLEALGPKLRANPRIRAFTMRREDLLVSVREDSKEALRQYREMLGLAGQQVRHSTISSNRCRIKRDNKLVNQLASLSLSGRDEEC